jgi:hypothetical protein
MKTQVAGKLYRKQEGKEAVISELSERIWIRRQAVMKCINDVICPDMTVLQYANILRLL